MKTRIISGLVAIVLLFSIALSKPVILAFSVMVLSIIALSEFYKSVSAKNYNPMKVIGIFSNCIVYLFIILPKINKSLNNKFIFSNSFLYLFSFVVIVALFSIIVIKPEKYNFVDIGVTILGNIYVTFLFSFVILTRFLENGFNYIWFIFIGAWITDTCAYFAGVTFGKTKILPKISPKKSLEGSIGGVIGCIIANIIYGIFIINNKSGISIPIEHLIILGILCGTISQLGDWSASAIKRKAQIKDFGKIMPGHGGVLDRCDSILFVAPIVYFYVSLVL